jgi:hypothetical protein
LTNKRSFAIGLLVAVIVKRNSMNVELLVTFVSLSNATESELAVPSTVGLRAIAALAVVICMCPLAGAASLGVASKMKLEATPSASGSKTSKSGEGTKSEMTRPSTSPVGTVKEILYVIVSEGDI